MQKKYILPFLISAHITHAETISSPREALELINKAQEKVESISTPDPSCYICNITMSPEANESDQVDICEDLFGASCLDKTGKNRFSNINKDQNKEIAQIIKTSRNNAAKKMGYKDFDDGLKKTLHENGIELDEPMNPSDWARITRDTSFDGKTNDNDDKSAFSTVNQCNAENSKLNEIDYTEINNTAELNSLLTKFNKFENDFNEKRIAQFAKNIPYFINTNIQVKCKLIKRNKSYLTEQDNLKVSETCKNIELLQRESIDLFRSEGSPTYQEKAQKFVRENILPELVYNTNNKSSKTSQTPTSEADQLRRKIAQKSSQLQNYCLTYESLIESNVNTIAGNYLTRVNKSKENVESLIDTFYGKDTKNHADEIFKLAKAAVQQIVGQFVADKKVSQQINSEYDDLKLAWITKPSEASYQKENTGMSFLDEATTNRTDRRLAQNDIFEIFSDPSLSYFSSMNAFYSAPYSYGTKKTSEFMNINPGLLKGGAKNPYSLLAVMSHELAHKIDPNNSYTNGYPLNDQYKKLLNCYKSDRSINLQPGQEGEVFADYISAEVLARQLNRIPSYKRKSALKSAMADLCIASLDFDPSRMELTHPTDLLRINGIYGATPNLRKAVGCDIENKKFDNCSISTIKNDNVKGVK